MEFKEIADAKEAKKLLKKALEDIITTETAIVSFLRTEYGNDAVERFYTEYRPKYILELQLGAIKRAIAKVAAKIAKKLLLKMIIDTFLEKGEWYQPSSTIEILKLENEGAVLQISPCNRKKMFKKIMKKKDKSVVPEYICQVMCSKEIIHYLAFIGLQPSFTFKDNGCIIQAVWDPTKIHFEEEPDENSVDLSA
ncbi:MAG: hypothetical protein ACTSRS_16395 [Candidatus Helarchaeota archaeon]